MKITCIADLHGFKPELEGGDLLIVAGDLTARDTSNEYLEFLKWLDVQKYDRKIVIAGNHDGLIQNGKKIKTEKGYFNSVIPILAIRSEYLQDSGTEYEGLKIWGSPWTPTFKGINPKCTAFTYGDETRFYDEKVMKIPHDIDILITHGPAYGILDEIPIEDGTLFHVGSKALTGYLKYVVRPKIHVFGHIHEAYGIKEVFPTYDDKMMISVNCSHVNEKYKPVNKPIEIIL